MVFTADFLRNVGMHYCWHMTPTMLVMRDI
jgi:hypothetical protein